MRGWGPEAFARAKPEFMAAVRWGLFAEKAGPILASWREIEAVKVTGDTPNLAAMLAHKAKAATVIPELTELLYPEDDDGR